MKRYAPLFTATPVNATLAPVPKGSEAFVLAELFAAGGRSILHIAQDDRQMDVLAHALQFFAPEAEILSFPAWDCLPYDRVSPNPTIIAERVTTLARLANKPAKPVVILTTINALLQRVPPQAAMKNAAMMIRKGQRIDRENLMRFLAKNGYSRLGKAMEPGEFAVRGSIIDIFPPGYTEGVRLDMFDDELEALRLYDPLTQVSSGELTELTLHTMSEYVLDETSIQNFRNRYRETFGAITKTDSLYEAVSSGQHYPGMEHWLPLLHEKLETLFDYLPKDSLITHGHDADATANDRLATISDYYEARKSGARASGAMSSIYHPLAPNELYLSDVGYEKRMELFTTIELTPFDREVSKDEVLVELPFKGGRNFSQEKEKVFDALKAYIGLINEQRKPLVLACYSTGSRERIRHLLAENGLSPKLADDWKTAKRILPPQIPLVLLPLEHGFDLDSFTLLTEQDLLGERVMRSTRKRKKSDAFMDEASSLTPGELVVHAEHGIGRFEGLVTVEVLGAAHDCLKLVYDGDDKLFIPVENIDVLTRYGASDEEGEAKLDKLGGVAWQARKARMKERIKIAAEALLKVAAARAINPAPVLISPAGMYEEFAARFPYVETEDQDRSISEVLEDLASGHPSDRLVCGDVGFGKTEVAMRAAFVAATAENGKVQVVVVTPTTLLCRQHYANFTERFAGLPVTIRQLSRLVTAKQASETRAGLKDGSVDIVIGTHAVLAKSVEFANLGLVIVDEEQHFGVIQKERLKNLKHNVHVLTLSATPIPRTLQLALTGVRDLSLITTPPVDRLAVRSFVMPVDTLVLREAIMREKHRGGRVFYVVPRIKDLAEVGRAIKEMTPDIKFAVAHGQMAPADLDQIMTDFYEGKYDLLLSTTIIESGLDIPTANTMIIHKADRFGLSQLYQLRGRVGRGKTRAYAYFTLPHGKTLTKTALQRLEVMQTLDTLGAGFTLASHDMDIRGFGNLVGEEQSGHVREVGVELYQQMFEEAVAAARHAQRKENKETADELPPTERWTPQINLGLSVLIPEVYVPDLQLRLGLYRRMGHLHTNEDIDNFAVELADRFGPLPEETEHLLGVLKLKILCRIAGVERVDVGPKGAVLAFRGDMFAQPEKLVTYLTKNPRNVKIRHDQKLVLMREWKPDAKSRLAELFKALDDIAALAA